MVSVLAILAAGQGAYAQEAVLSACSGVSLPRSVVTDVISPVVTGVVQPLENTTNGLIGALTPPLGGLLPGPVNTNITGLLRGATTGNPVSLSAISNNGTLVGPADNCVATARPPTNIVPGPGDTDGDLISATDDAIRYDDTTRAVATLRGTSGTRVTNLAAGVIGATSTDAVNGSQLASANRALSELSSIAVVYDVDQQGRKLNGVTLKGADTSKPVAVHNVARGEAPTDAVNVAQLDEGLANNRSYADRVAGDSYDRSRAYTDAQVGEVRDEARQAAAIGLAASSLRFDGTPGKVSVGASGGVWRGEAAFAVGVGYTNENGKVRANATATAAGGALGAGGGFTVTLN